jgi:hypothetical protein
VARSGGKGGAPGHGILSWAEREAREDARRPIRCSPATRSAGWPAMARRPGFTSGGARGGGERVWEHGRVQRGNCSGSGSVL